MTGPERTLRDEIARLTQGSITSGNGVDRLTEFVQARVDAARADTAEEIAQALAAVPDEVYPEDVFGPVTTDDTQQIHQLLKAEELPSLDRISANIMRHAYRMATRIAREHAATEGPRP